MVVPDWALQGTTADFVRIAADRDLGRKLRAGIEQRLEERDGGTSLRIARYQPGRTGRGSTSPRLPRARGPLRLRSCSKFERHGGARGDQLWHETRTTFAR